MKPFNLTFHRWAWQHTDNSRHADFDDPSEKQSDTRINPKTGKRVKRGVKRRITCLSDAITRLHVLLRSRYFSGWPLEVQFFCPDVRRVWKECSEDADDLPGTQSNFKQIEADTRKRNFHGLEVSNKNLKSYREKVAFLLDDEELIHCGVCKKGLHLRDSLIAVCSHDDCHCASHLLCLASRFLEEQGTQGKIIPASGECPACKKTVEWSTLMREVSLRIRGQPVKRNRKRKDVEIRNTPPLEHDRAANSGTESDTSRDIQGRARDDWQADRYPGHPEPYDEIIWDDRPAAGGSAESDSFCFSDEEDTARSAMGRVKNEDSWDSVILID